MSLDVKPIRDKTRLEVKQSKSDHLPRLPCTFLALAGTNSGKTTTIVNMCLNPRLYRDCFDRIEIFSQKIAGHGDADCPGHPVWLAKTDTPTPDTPCFLVANQPVTRLHSQLDFGGHSVEAKHRGREVARMNPRDAAARDAR